MVLHVSVIKKWNFKHYATNEYSSVEKEAEDGAEAAVSGDCNRRQ
jgi:hypothetical protein